ncbi:hypothetical protein H8R23_14500 [Flavobacterium sp. F-380]|uniref:Uncharacterized protein n=1 Tax=Flavobacterium kayseriense TaxID=2764714 RepID=A0ABR7JAR2_9FLAO|nr:hypothetical protein [Flavobacterium kayseriense]MBC5842621.1 hypothetical protein [Flavobacterium kayseriense]MBC5849151.1 hypothetical protein [Flavobacterium kayseriense]
MIHWFGDTILRLDKINAIQHNSVSDSGPTNIVNIYLDDAAGSRIDVVFWDYEQASDSVSKLNDLLEDLYFQKTNSK